MSVEVATTADGETVRRRLWSTRRALARFHQLRDDFLHARKGAHRGNLARYRRFFRAQDGEGALRRRRALNSNGTDVENLIANLRTPASHRLEELGRQFAAGVGKEGVRNI